MAYPPVDPLDSAEPLDSRPALYGAAELRALKGRVNTLETDLEAQIAAALAASGGGIATGGRITLTSGSPLMVAAVAGVTNVYFTPYLSNLVFLWDGAAFVPVTFAELTNDLTDNTKNPAAAAPNSLYDLFVWDDAGTKRFGRGPAWASGTTRGVGAGTTELELLNGSIYVNKVAITNGPVARKGTYVGTILTDGASQLNWYLGGTAVNGLRSKLHVYNYYNQISIRPQVKDTDDWTEPLAGVKMMNTSAENRFEFIVGIVGKAVHGHVSLTVYIAGAGDDAEITLGFGLDSQVAFAADCIKGYYFEPDAVPPNSKHQCEAVFNGLVGIGSHYLQALYDASNVGFLGSLERAGLAGEFWM